MSTDKLTDALHLALPNERLLHELNATLMPYWHDGQYTLELGPKIIKVPEATVTTVISKTVGKSLPELWGVQYSAYLSIGYTEIKSSNIILAEYCFIRMYYNEVLELDSVYADNDFFGVINCRIK